MAARFNIPLERFIGFHVTEGGISTLGIASSKLEWTPEDYPFENRNVALRAVRVVLEEYPGSQSHQMAYLEKGRRVYEEIYREEVGLSPVMSLSTNQSNRKTEVEHV